MIRVRPKKRPARSRILYPFARLLVTPTLLFVPPRPAQDEIGFIESFVLASDRAEVLKQLIPGTEDYYYHQALHAQNGGDLSYRISP